MFQSTPPHRGRLRREQHQPRHRTCFNPRPRTGGDARRMGHWRWFTWFQSTPPHRGRLYAEEKTTPVNKSTGFRTQNGPKPTPGGERLPSLRVKPEIRNPLDFNPRPRTGGDSRTRPCRSRGPGFNPRPRTGGDSAMMSSINVAQMFQSTPPHRGRPVTAALPCRALAVSIHAPAQGAT